MSCGKASRGRIAVVVMTASQCVLAGERRPAFRREISKLSAELSGRAPHIRNPVIKPALMPRLRPVSSVSIVPDTPIAAVPSPYARIELAELFQLAARADEIPWLPFRDGVDIHRLYGDGISGPSAALLRFKQAGVIPLHAHAGYEHILVLAGSQRDQNSRAEAGTLMINPPGTQHRVVSEAGCIVLAIYEKPVVFLEKPQ